MKAEAITIVSADPAQPGSERAVLMHYQRCERSPSGIQVLSMLELIQRAEVVRCPATGYWSHPQLPPFGEDRAAFEAWFTQQGLSVAWDEMEWSGSQDHPYWTEGAAHCLGWEPEAPAGDGWFKLSIFDSEHGPVCSWARRVSA